MFEDDIAVASENWKRWREVFEHDGPPRENPLLGNPGLFANFVSEYSVQRTIRSGKRDLLRARIADSSFPLDALLADNTGDELDRKERALRPEFGTVLGLRSIRSALSKIASFLAPDKFIAWDQYARRGLNDAVGKNRSSKFESYADYLATANAVLSGPLGHKIQEACVGCSPSNYARQHDRFHRRVLDVHLMRRGTRDFRKGRVASD